MKSHYIQERAAEEGAVLLTGETGVKGGGDGKGGMDCEMIDGQKLGEEVEGVAPLGSEIEEPWIRRTDVAQLGIEKILVYDD